MDIRIHRFLIVMMTVLTLSFVCASISVNAVDSESVYVKAQNKEISVPVRPIEKDGVSYLFLPSGATDESISYPEGKTTDDYSSMTDEKIGSLHFFSEDPVNFGMDYIHGSSDHSTKAPGRIVLLDENGNVEYEGGIEAIKGRGNSTWKKVDKKPYQIKLAKKVNLLDPGDDTQKAKKWILLADAFDTTLIRNEITYSLAREMGLESTPEGKHVDLYYDGEYRGVYFLCEKVEIGKGRIEINDMEEHPEITTGGYLLEIDRLYYIKEPAYFKDKLAGPVVCKSPEEPTDEQSEYIRDIVREAMACIENGGKSPDGDKTLFDYFDRDSLVRYFLINEWIINTDAYRTSTYMYKPENSDKLFMGPIWDCDHSMGKNSMKTTWGSWHLPFLARDLIRIPEFRQALQEEYVNNMRPLIKDTLLGKNSRTYLKTYEETTDRLSMAALMNHKVWTLMVGGGGVKYWSVKIEELNQWLNNRAEWFDATITDERFPDDTWELADQADPNDTSGNNSHEKSKPVTSKVNNPSSLRPAKPKLKIKAKKRSLTVSWDKVKKASGYQIRCCQKKKKSNSLKPKKTKKRTIKLKKLKRKTWYIVQVRAYRSVNGIAYYSPWRTKVVKTK